jgi:SpoVK/Ycf46/Vps4 family AAA+-type ATPase
LQFIEQDASDSLIIGATNSPKLLDRALFRRFDDVLYYDHPKEEERKHLMQNILGAFQAPRFAWKGALSESEGLSHGEIDQACRDAIKQAILTDRKSVNPTLLREMLRERQNARGGLRG